jgi:PhnB protein
MQIQPYLFFEGCCDDALAYYQEALGARVEALLRYKDNPSPEHNPPGAAQKVMHCNFRVGDTQLMVSDGNCSGKPRFQGFALTLNARDEPEARRLFAALADGGQVQMPLGKTFFSSAFGMVNDRFGVMWMVIVPAQGQ